MDRIQKALLEYLRCDAPGAGAIGPPLSPDEWAFLAPEARRHGVAPLLYYKFQRRAPSPEIPARVLSELQKAYFLNGVANRRRFRYLEDALRVLTAAGIPIIVLKGAYLAEAVYPNIALRTMGDVDLLVRESDLPKAVGALQSAGFSPKERHLEPPKDANEFHFVHRASRMMIELHWRLYSPKYSRAFNSDSIWDRASRARIAGADVSTLSPEDLLIHLCTHAAIHAFKMGLKALCDIAEICPKLPVDWANLAARARAEGATRPTWLLLMLSNRLLGAAVPETILDSLSPASADTRLLSAAQEAIFLEPPLPRRKKSKRPWEILFFGRKRATDQARLVKDLLFPSRLRMAADYHCRPDSLLIFLYYPLWMAKCLKRGIPVLWAELVSRIGGGSHSETQKNAAELMDWVIPTSS